MPRSLELKDTFYQYVLSKQLSCMLLSFSFFLAFPCFLVHSFFIGKAELSDDAIKTKQNVFTEKMVVAIFPEYS